MSERVPDLTPRKRRGEWVWAPLLILFVTFWLYRTVWFAPEGKPRQWLGWDCIESYWPDIAYYAGALGHGEWPAWNPYDRGGYAFYGDTVTGLYYPLTWIFVSVGAIGGGMPGWAIQLKALLQIAIGGLTLYAFLRSRKLPAAAAALGGIVFVVSLPMIIHKASALAWPMVWAPIIWIAIDRAIERAREAGWWRRAAALAGAIGLAGAAGPPPGFFYILIVSLAYGALRLGQALYDAPRRKPEAIAQARTLAVAGAATLALLGVVVLPGLAIAGESATRGETRDLGYALNTALPAGRALAGMVSPPGGVVDAYLGVLVLVLGLVAVGLRPRADRWVPVLFLGLAVFALLLAFGGATPLLPWLVKHVPGFGYFREPNRYKIVTAMCMAVVAAYGLAALMAADAAGRRRALLVLGGAVLTLGVAVLWIKSGTAPPRAPLPKHAPGFATSLVVLAVGGALLAAIVLVPARLRATVAAAAIAVCYLDVAGFAWNFKDTREAPVDDQADRKYLAGLGDVEREWRVYDEFVMEQRPGSRLRVRDLRGYPSGDPFDDARYADVRARLRKNPELVGAYNVKWVLWGPHHRNGISKNHIQPAPDRTAPARFKKLDGKRWEVIDPAPLVVWYGAATQVTDKKAALEAVVAMEKTPGLRVRAVVEQTDAPSVDLAGLAAASVPPAPVAGRLVAYGANRIAVEIDAPAEGVVVLNEKMLNGWSATVDGKRAAGFRANYMLRGVLVPAGQHTIVWTFAPPNYRLLTGAWFAGVGFLLVAGVSGWRLRRRAPVVASPAP